MTTKQELKEKITTENKESEKYIKTTNEKIKSDKNVILEKEEELICPICGSTNIIRDYERAEIVCENCGCVLQQNLFDVGPEWRAFDHEQRVKRSRVGAPMTYSVDYSEPIIIRENGEIKVVKIGELIDKIIENAENVRREGILEISKCKGIEVIAFDNNYKFKFMPVSEVSRHPVNEIFEIIVEGNKKVKVTGSHSVFTIKNNEVVPIRVDELKVGDILVLAKELPNVEENIEINLVEIVKDLENIYVQFDYPYENKDWRRRKSTPLKYILENNIPIPDNATIRCGSGKSLPIKIKVDERFAKILGYFIAEGHYDDRKIVFSFRAHEKEYIEEVVDYFKSLNLNPIVYNKGSSVQIEINSKILVELFKKLNIKSGAKNKRIPPIVFKFPANLKKAFLIGYFNGDGNLYINEKYSTVQLRAVSASKELIEDLAFLLLQLGINANYGEEFIKGHIIEKTGQYVKDSHSYILTITNPEYIKKLGYIDDYQKENKKPPISNLIPAPDEYKKEWKFRSRDKIGRDLALKIAKKYNDRKLEKLINSDFIFLKIKEINKTKPTNGYAYDLTVPNAENFVAGFGGFVLHNTIHDKGLSTVIDWRNKDSYGKDISANKRAQLYRLRKWQRRIRVSDASERNLAFALSELDRIASKLGLPRNVRENAAVLYRGAVEKGLIRGRSIEGVAAAALYAACRRCRVPRTLDEISEASRVDRKEIGRTYRFLSRELGIKLAPTNPIDYVPRFASELGLPGEVESKAIAILQKAAEKGLTSGRGPTGVAAAAIYIASVLLGNRRTQRDVAEVAGVTEVTIRNRYKELTEHLDIDVTL
ncbi:Transcription factor TFIIB cyclin-related protein [Methanotorris formicicus Mc-S-70]|uniref:Transcription initiation factor IIB n=1 Tax=Methanotorris formicicus Mc-S-70 TaxID=647171 RepID=H1KYE3_9EURY|nr:Transcription factor TFIIB cyclin-related protein [Methanotorris formicicus Mc-S-70]